MHSVQRVTLFFFSFFFCKTAQAELPMSHVPLYSKTIGVLVVASFFVERLDTSALLMNAVVGTAMITLIIGENRHLARVRASRCDKWQRAK